MNSLYVAEMLMITGGIILIIYGLRLLHLVFVYKREVEARFMRYKKTRKGIILYFGDEKCQYRTHMAYNKADINQYMHPGLQKIYVDQDQCLLHPSYYFVRGLVAIGIGMMIIAMAIVSF